MIEEPLFVTTRGALWFAHNFTHGSLKKSAMAAMIPDGEPAGKGLGGLDGAAQAGMILAEVSTLSPLGQNLTMARYAPRKALCKCGSHCCTGFKPNRQWSEAIDWLANHVHAAVQVGVFSHYHLRRALVMRYFGEESNFRDIAAKCGVNKDTASHYNQKISAYLSAQEAKIEQQADELLRTVGVVGDPH